MATLPFILVFISIFTHAYWNYLIKSSDNKHIFTAYSKLAELIIFALPALYFLVTSEFKLSFLGLAAIAATITFLNYFFLAIAYKHGELSLVYPVSRSSILFLPLLAYIFIDERIDTVGSLAIALILVGTLVMHLNSLDKNGLRSFFVNIRNKGSIFALLAALAVAGYTLWDKISIEKMQPFLYFYLYTCIVALLYNSYTHSKFSKAALKKRMGNQSLKNNPGRFF